VNFTILFYISLALLGALLIISAKKRPKDETFFFDRILSKEIQGFLAIFIIFHHTVITLINFGEDTYNLKEFYNYNFYGIIAVAFFFFCSGFGLVKRWLTDNNYTKGFMKRRIFTVLVPYFICNYIYLTEALLGNIRYGNHFSFVQVICAFFGLFLVNNQMWFAVEIMLLYAAFRLIFGTVKKAKTGILLMTGVVLVMVTIGFFSQHSYSLTMSYWFQGEWWYNTILMFPVGMFYAYKEERINNIIRKAFTAILLSSAVLVVIFDYIHRDLTERMIYYTGLPWQPGAILDRLTGLTEETIFELVFIILVITIVSKIKIGNPVLKFLGKISLEVIMLNYFLIENLYFIYEKYGLTVYVPAVLIGTIVFASVVYLIKNLVLERRSGLFDGDVS
jgi:hypothetical protein